MSSSKYDSHRGKATRIRLIKEILADSGGLIKCQDLEKLLRERGYPHLIEKLKAMGFTVDDQDYVVKSSTG